MLLPTSSEPERPWLYFDVSVKSAARFAHVSLAGLSDRSGMSASLFELRWLFQRFFSLPSLLPLPAFLARRCHCVGVRGADAGGAVPASVLPMAHAGAARCASVNSESLRRILTIVQLNCDLEEPPPFHSRPCCFPSITSPPLTCARTHACEGNRCAALEDGSVL